MEVPHLDVLQNLEVVVFDCFGQHPTMTDYNVIRVYEAVLDTYAAEQVGRPPRILPTNAIEQELFKDMMMVCEWRLGRCKLDDGTGAEPIDPSEPLPLPVLQSCLKRLLNSAKRWNRDNGRQGYLTFISQYIR